MYLNIMKWEKCSLALYQEDKMVELDMKLVSSSKKQKGYIWHIYLKDKLKAQFTLEQFQPKGWETSKNNISKYGKHKILSTFGEKNSWTSSLMKTNAIYFE